MKRHRDRVRRAVSQTLVSLVVCSMAGATLITLSASTARADVTGGALGTPFVYGCAESHPGSNGDTWYNTWADDDHIYATSDDSNGFAGTCQGTSFHGSCPGGPSNLVVNELDGPDPEHLSSPFTNCMTSYGTAGSQGDQTNCPDGDTWKTGGVISVGGVLYLVVSRQSDAGNQYPAGYQATEDASIVKSTDHGRTWTSTWTTTPTSTGAAPACNAATGHYNAMFPGSRFANAFFINYGQDDATWSANDGNGGDTYVYAMANDGFAYNGSNEILARVLKADLGSLDATKWQFYENNGFSGGSGNDTRNWTGDMNQATLLISAPHQLSQASVQYVPGLQRYVMTSFYYPNFDQCWWLCNGVDEARPTNLVFYQAPTPWGPWTTFYNQSNGFGWYDPTLVSKFVRLDGMSQTVFTSGDFGCFWTHDCPAPDLYSLHAVPFAMTADSLAAADDTSPSITYHGSWIPLNAAGYFNDGTLHASSTSGDSISFTFNGTFVAWIGATNNNHGWANVSIDGGQTEGVDTYSPQWGKQGILFERNHLAVGSHTITITVTSTKDAASSGTYQDVDAFEYGSTPPPVAALDDSTAGAFGSSWIRLTNSNYFESTLHVDCTTSLGTANTATYTFTGPSVKWIGATNNNHGDALVSVDGAPGFGVDTYSPQWGYQTVLFERTGLADGTHTLTIIPTAFKDSSSSGTCQDVDAFSDGL